MKAVMNIEECREKFILAALKREEARVREMEEYANQRVIEELDKLLENKFQNGYDPVYGSYYAVNEDTIVERIKELKQE